MAQFPWLPVSHDLGDGTLVGCVVREGFGYQVLRSMDGMRSAILLRGDGLAASYGAREVPQRFRELSFGGQDYLTATCAIEHEPVRVEDLPRRPEPLSAVEANILADALLKMTKRAPKASWREAVFLFSEGTCLPTDETPDREIRKELAIKLLTGGVANPKLSVRQIHALNPWLTLDEITEFLNKLADTPIPRMRSNSNAGSEEKTEEFTLPGHPGLEVFLKEYVIDHFRLKHRYDAMGVHPPNGILLYGPPGSGKTHAVKRLTTHLQWQLFEIHLGSIGSPYVHQTSVQLRRTFDNAAAQSPSILVFDEIDAVASTRGPSSQEFKVEEVSELLKLVEGAAKSGILVIATTNRKEAIDPAFLRKGRFDHCFEVGYPAEEAVRSALTALLEDRPHVAAINVDRLAQQLAGRPMSDVAWVINEAARLAVKSAKDAIDDICLFNAAGRLD